MKNSIKDDKIQFRRKQFLVRKKIFSSVTNFFNEYLFDQFFKKIKSNNIKVVSSFISINTEINTNELNNYILKKNKLLCLPVILKKNEHLIFRKFNNYNDLVEGFMKIKEPPITSEILIPDLLFVPCLAYDKYGYRLGYGGGYYDRTFSYLKNISNNFVSVGYAFDEQKVDKVPKDRFDIKLDYVITEKKIYSFI